MRRRTRVTVFVLGTTIVCALGTLVFLAIQSKRNALMHAPPLTVKAVEQLAEAFDTRAPEPAAIIVEEPGAMAADDAAAASPPRLARAVTAEERLQRLGRAKGAATAKVKQFVFDGMALYCRVADIDDEEGGCYWEAGQEAEKLGNVELARAYYREALNHPLYPYKRVWCLSRLAWYEDDPEVASALVAAACATDEPNFLSEAVRISSLTGSVEARDHYLARLREARPEEAGLLAEELGLGAEL